MYDWVKDLKWIEKHLKSGKIISKKLKNGLLIPFKGATVSTKPPKYFTDFATEVRSFMKQQLAFNEMIWNKVETIEKNVSLIMRCPTIKKEISELEEK